MKFLQLQLLAIAVVVFVGAQTAQAQFSSGFEDLSASLNGTVLTGQDGYYLPSGTNNTDLYAYTYTDNVLGLPQNPSGGSNFIAGTGPGFPTYGRAQRDVDLSFEGRWTLAFDTAATFDGSLPASQYIGSFSMQPFPGSSSFIAFFQWADPFAADAWNASYTWFTEEGFQVIEVIPDADFQNLPVDAWYRWETDVDFVFNKIREVRLTDLDSGTTFTYQPVDRYMEGGAAGSGAPTGFRFFAGGSDSGNYLAFDNLSLDAIPELTVPALGGLALWLLMISLAVLGSVSLRSRFA